MSVETTISTQEYMIMEQVYLVEDMLCMSIEATGIFIVLGLLIWFYTRIRK